MTTREPMARESATRLLEARGIVKRFGALLANDVGHFSVGAGEVVALLGENGAGKSTLAKILYGFYSPDAGQIWINGKQTEFSSPRDARHAGIGMVFQNFTLVPALSVFENLALFQKDLPIVVPRAAILEQMRHYTDRFHLAVDPWMAARHLAVGDQQKVEILKQLLAGTRLLILDEPTKVLAPQEREGLFRTIAELRSDGLGVVLITHKLREALDCADRIVVMRHGRIAGVVEQHEAKEADLLRLMFGEAPGSSAPAKIAPDRQEHEPVLELKSVWTSGRSGAVALRNVCLKVPAGEIVGVAGVSGNGQRELGDLVLGLDRPQAGTKLLWGENASRWSVAKVRQKGVSMVPDDPLSFACIPNLTVRENLALGAGRGYARRLGVDWPRLDRDMRNSFVHLGFPAPPFESRIATLSGGNLQRVVLARELARAPRLIVALYPTRGLDTRSTSALRSVISAARDRGAAVLWVSEDLDELFAVSDRVVVMFRGAVAGEFTPEQFAYETVGPVMVGVAEQSDAA